MPLKRHIVVYVSSHGYGHFGQIAPILNALSQSQEVKVTLVTALPASLIASRLLLPVNHVPTATDFGMRMVSAFTVQLEESYQDYVKFHQEWQSRFDLEVERLQSLKPDLVIANVPYLPLAAAAQLGIPSIALCSLNWAEIFWAYFHDREHAGEIHKKILQCYNSAQTFLCPQPSMPMPNLHNVKTIGPIAATGTSRRAEIQERFQVRDGEKIIMIAPGGIPTRIPLETWPYRPGIRYILTWDQDNDREDFIHLQALGYSFADVLCSCDAVVTKPGYGMVAETACNGVPVLYATRGDWPEEPHLVQWWHENAKVKEISLQQIIDGNFQKEFSELTHNETAIHVAPTGIAQAVEEIKRLLS